MQQTENIYINIPGAPPSANKAWRISPRGGNYISKEFKQWFELVKATVAGAKAPSGYQFYKVELIVTPTRRSGDVDNKIKPTLDALTRCGFWEDDKNVSFVSCCFTEPNKQGRTLIIVSGDTSKYKSITSFNTEIARKLYNV